MAYHIKWSDNIAIFEFEDSLSDQELYDSNQEVLNSINFDQMRGQLINQIKVKTIDVSSKCMETIAKWDTDASKKNPDVKIAVIPGDSTQFGLTRMYEMYSDGSSWETQLFSDIETAMNWLKK